MFHSTHLLNRKCAMCQERILIFVPILLHVASSYREEVKVEQGNVIGSRASTVFEGRLYYAFYGIPYAQPPVKELRFKDPKPPKKWKKPLDASVEYHGACAQPHVVHKHALYGFENCLHLNIYTPQLPKYGGTLMPVVIWIHGYAFSSSFSHIHGADFLIDHDILFISVTHRIGVFGFLKLNDTDTNGNMGFKDIILALKWIRKNIKRFGGDKNHITVMGNGSAGTFLSLLLTTKYKKLFSKMILQSGTIYSPALFQSNHALERERLKKELKKISSNDLFSASTKDIIKASLNIYNSKEVTNFQRPVVPFTPILEKESKRASLTKRPENFYSSFQNLSIPIMIGFNSQESISEVIPFLHNPRYLRSYSSYFKYMVPFTDGCRFSFASEIYKAISNQIKYEYFDGPISETSIHNFVRYVSDLVVYPVLKFVKILLNTSKSKLYLYKFNYVGNFSAVKATSMAGTNLRVKGAAGGDEICYILKCEPMWESYVAIINDLNNADRAFIKETTKLWSNFVKTGNPTPASYYGNVTWLPTTLENDYLLVISKVNKLRKAKREEKMFSFWENIYEKYYSKENCLERNHDEL